MTVRTIQSQLKSKNLYAGAIDGIWGKMSQEGIEKYVPSHGKLYFDFNKFREEFKVSVISQSFVDNINVIFSALEKWKDLGSLNPLYVAYMLATTWHETGYTMAPVKERGSYQYLAKYDTGRLARVLGNTPEADGDGQLYAGRGYVQITGKTNYKKFSKTLGIDLENNPDYTLKPEVAADILIYGSLKGSFTGRGLSHYIRRGSLGEFTEARRVINGTDKAVSIARHAEKFLRCIILTT